MPRKKGLNWKGDEVFKRVQEACAEGIEITMAECVKEAKQRPRMPFLTGALQGSIAMRSPKVTKQKVEGKWGSFDVNYAFFQEVGFRGRPGRRFLRDAADQEYPKLAGRIKEAFR